LTIFHPLNAISPEKFNVVKNKLPQRIKKIPYRLGSQGETGRGNDSPSGRVGTGNLCPLIKREMHMTPVKRRRTALAAILGLAICLGYPAAGHADRDDGHRDWHHGDHDRDRDRFGVVIGVPALSLSLGDDVFAESWNRSDYEARAEFCHHVRHECYEYGHYSRACHLKWRYCSPEGRDYGFYFNH
jgi:hypothetical protein